MSTTIDRSLARGFILFLRSRSAGWSTLVPMAVAALLLSPLGSIVVGELGPENSFRSIPFRVVGLSLGAGSISTMLAVDTFEWELSTSRKTIVYDSLLLCTWGAGTSALVGVAGAGIGLEGLTLTRNLLIFYGCVLLSVGLVGSAGWVASPVYASLVLLLGLERGDAAWWAFPLYPESIVSTFFAFFAFCACVQFSIGQRLRAI